MIEGIVPTTQQNGGLVMSNRVGRRGFVGSVVGLGAAVVVPAGVVVAARSGAAAHPERAPEPSRGSAAPVYEFFTRPEAAFVEAAVARLIPADELGPGALEAGVPYFIDRQLAGSWGSHARNYRLGPWSEGTPQQGYQSPLTPQQLYRGAIAETNRHCDSKHAQSFDALTVPLQEEVLRALQAGAIAMEIAPAPLFFETLWQNTKQGFFSDPMYAGNRDKVGWKLIGFPGVAAAYITLIEKHDEEYRVQPVSISDLSAGSAPVDEHGHPVHVRVRTRE